MATTAETKTKRLGQSTKKAGDLSNCIQGLKKMAAANRGKAKAQQKEQLSLDRNLKNDQLRDESALAHYENNQMTSRSSSTGKIAISQQPRQGASQSRPANKQRKSGHGSSRENLQFSQQIDSNGKESPLSEQSEKRGSTYALQSRSKHNRKDPQINCMQPNYQISNEREDQRRSQARSKEFSRPIEMNASQAVGSSFNSGKNIQNSSKYYGTEDKREKFDAMRQNTGTAGQQRRRQDSASTRRSQQSKMQDTFQAGLLQQSASKNMQTQGSRKSHSTGRAVVNKSTPKKTLKEANSFLNGTQIVRQSSQVACQQESSQMIKYQTKRMAVPQRKSQDLFKVYLNYQPQAESAGRPLALQTPQAKGQQQQQHDLSLLNRHNNLVSKNRQALGQQSNCQSQAMNTNYLNESLPLISSSSNYGVSTKDLNAHKDLKRSQDNHQSFGAYGHASKSSSKTVQRPPNLSTNLGQAAMQTQSQGSKMQLSTTAYQTANYKSTGFNPLNGTATTHVYNHNASSLDQYNNHQFASINQSMLMRNLNYSILQGEIEQETALEDMHMFFVAFQKRQKRIVEFAEQLEMKQNNNNNSTSLKEEASPGANVISLSEEIDLE